MKIAEIKKVAEKVSKKYGMPKPIVTKIKSASGDNQVEIRSELTSYEGGNEMSALIEKLVMSALIEKIDSSYICEAQGGCVYVVYQPK